MNRPLRTITITEDAFNDFTVREGDRYCDRLTADEAIAQITKIVGSSFPGFPMLTAEEHAEHERGRQARLAARETAGGA